MMDPLTASVAKFQLTAARRRLGHTCTRLVAAKMFQLTAARRRLVPRERHAARQSPPFQLTAARRRLGHEVVNNRVRNLFQLTAARRRLEPVARAVYIIETGFNSQPPEGGWKQARR